MSLSPGSRLGAYEIVALLGAGGMGEVYRARDTRLKREVAIKVLPDEFVLDPDRLARFRREAEVLASLNHPHIAALHGMEIAGDRQFLIMELVEGETLAERLQHGLLPVGEALRVAIQIAEALEAAHERGIVHRDLKPANIKLGSDDRVKVLDFGLARAMETTTSAGSASMSPTLSLMATQAGVILGTAAYMSPEQAKGLPADHRSDVFSFGCVLYEMLAGRQPFQGDTVADVLASVLAREPDLGALPPSLNPRLIDLLRRCFDKNPRKRWHAIADVRGELELVIAAPLGASSAMTGAPSRRRNVASLIVAMAAGAIGYGTAVYLRPAAPVPVSAKFVMPLPAGQEWANTTRNAIAVSPDGTKVAYIANLRVFVRSLTDLEPKPIAGDESANIQNLAFSPDGQSVAYWSADGGLKRVATTGTAPVTIAQGESPFGISWGLDGIVFAPGGRSVMRVSPNGGKPEELVIGREGESISSPQTLPGGNAILFTVASGASPDRWERAHVVVQSLRSSDRKTVIEGGSGALYVPTGHLLYALRGSVYAIPFDLATFESRGGSIAVIEGVRRGAASGAAHIAVSATGSLVFVPGPRAGGTGQFGIAVTNKDGALRELPLQLGQYDAPRVSPDGTRVAYESTDASGTNVWVYELSGASAPRRLTFAGNNKVPVWSADGQQIVFQSDREGDRALFRQRADGSKNAERLTRPETGASHVPDSSSRDGKVLLYDVVKDNLATLWTLSLDGRKSSRFGAIVSSIPTAATFSPDSRWVAYNTAADVTAVYVEPFPATGAKYQIPLPSYAVDPHHPVWSRDGKELLFILGPGSFAVTSVHVEPTFGFSSILRFQPRILNRVPDATRGFDVMSDGRLIGVSDGQGTGDSAAVPPIVVVLNWFEELKRRVPVN